MLLSLLACGGSMYALDDSTTGNEVTVAASNITSIANLKFAMEQINKVPGLEQKLSIAEQKVATIETEDITIETDNPTKAAVAHFIKEMNTEYANEADANANPGILYLYEKISRFIKYVVVAATEEVRDRVGQNESISKDQWSVISTRWDSQLTDGDLTNDAITSMFVYYINTNK